MYLLIDLAILLLLGLFMWRGAKKGLILTLCGLLAVAVALGGAFYVSNQFSQPVADFIQPYIETYVDGLVEDAIDSAASDPSGPLNSWVGSGSEDETVPATLDQILTALGGSKLLSRLSDAIQSAVNEGALVIATTAAAAVASFLALQLARVGLFLLSFLLLLLIWWLVSHLLDLAFRLPVLRTLNKTGGLLCGLLKGGLIVVVACWVVAYFQLLDPALTSHTYLFSLIVNFQPF